MFENYEQLPVEEKNKIKAFHKSCRAHCKEEGRYGNLVWGFVRGFPFRRIERSHKIQKENGFEHNMPKASVIKQLLFYCGVSAELSELESWLANKEGAIPAPPPRVKLSGEEIAEKYRQELRAGA